MYRNDSALWPVILEAAVVGSFLPKDLAPDITGVDRAAAERTVLEYSHTVQEPNGIRWSLTPEARGAVLRTVLDAQELGSVISRSEGRFRDHVSAALRNLISGKLVDISSLSDEALQDTRVALLSLTAVPNLSLPRLEQIDRELQLRRLLAQFKRITGERHRDGKKETLFVGRESELDRLREHVGMVTPNDRSFAAGVRRVWNFVSRGLTAEQPIVVWGVGGAGKTTLVAQFMLEHAEAAFSRFPFAYLDFDRTTISARDPLGLLVEMCAQTAAQFEELLTPMRQLTADIRRIARSLEITREPLPPTLLRDCARKFRRSIDALLQSFETRFKRDRPFLLVFDTYELVQYSDSDSKEMEQFVDAFRMDTEAGFWPRLRLVISGRKKMESFLAPLETNNIREIGPLPPDDSATLLMALARDAGKPIGKANADLLISAVARFYAGPESGVEPLRVQLLGEIFGKEQGDGPSIVDQLVAELSKPLNTNGIAARKLIDGILVRRVLEHVRGDRRVRALADPGLVVRRIDRDVIKNVMTAGTSDPNQPGQKDNDPSTFRPWIVDDVEAQSIFDEFKKEVALVEPDGEHALRHRADVREQIVPLIRAKSPNGFARLQRLAFQYFSEVADGDRRDRKSAAEAIYHGLWCGADLSRLNAYWNRHNNFHPRINVLEFDETSVAKTFLSAKTRADLTPFDLERLPPDVRLDWLDAKSSDFLGERRLTSIIANLRAAAGKQLELLEDRPEMAAVAARLLYRVGLWGEAVELSFRHLDRADAGKLIQSEGTDGGVNDQPPRSRSAAMLSMVRTYATISGKSGGPGPALEWLTQVANSSSDNVVRVEIAAHTLIGTLLAGGGHERAGWLRSVVADSAHRVSESEWRRSPRVLRLAALIAAHSAPTLIQIWADTLEQLPRELDAPVFGEALLSVFGRRRPEISAAVSKPSAEAFATLDDLWRAEKASIVEAAKKDGAVRSGLLSLAACDHSDWGRPLGNALSLAASVNSNLNLGPLLGEWGVRISNRFDGVGAVDAAIRIGRLLAVARHLAQWQGLRRDVGISERFPYPQGVFDLSQGLLRWHSTIQDHFLKSSKAEYEGL
jgi:hypothetical protein